MHCEMTIENMEVLAAEAERRIRQSRIKEDALANAISATEYLMKAMRAAKTAADKARLKERCMEAMDRAELIKAMKQWPPLDFRVESCPSSKKLVPPATKEPTTQEKLTLLENSRLHGLEFPPWKYDPMDDEFSATTGLYSDLSEVPISKDHMRDFIGWQRPSELLSHKFSDEFDSHHHLCTPSMAAFAPVDLVQDVTADCSVVASLCAALARPGTCSGELLDGILYPFDRVLGLPKLSANGKYIFRFNFNGCCRKVVIDDRLPGSKTNRTLHVFNRNQPGLLWPALIEKAYLTIRGGYDFPGSNSGTDLWVITGWIPEQIFLQSDELQEDPVWSRISKSFAFGDVVLTLGTGRLSEQEEQELGLVGEHDYAVLDMREKDGSRQLLVKNPWCDGVVWKAISKRPEPDGRKESDQGSCVDPSGIHFDPGTFWVDFEEVIKNFNSLYLNWNPGLFKHREDHHFKWKLPEVTSPGCFTYNPQFSLCSPSGGTVWVLLSRHFTTEEHNHNSQFKRSSMAPGRNTGFTSLYTFDADGRRIHFTDNALSKGPYVDSPQTLAKLEMPALSCYTIVVAQQDLPLNEYSFTLSAYSSSPCTLGVAASRYPCSVTQDGCWNSKTAGGNADSTRYSSNPQYELRVTSTTSLSIVLEATPRDLAVHIKLVWAAGRRVTSITSQSIATDSGEYRRGCAVADMSAIPAGEYTIVCSTFEAGQTGKFRLSVEAMAPCELVSLPVEDAGRLVTLLPILVLQDGVDRMLTPLNINRITRLKIIAGHRETEQGKTTHSPLRVSLEMGQGPNKRISGASSIDGYSDALGGARTGDIDVGPESCNYGGLWLVVERFGSNQAFDEVQVRVLSDSHVYFGAWGTGDG